LRDEYGLDSNNYYVDEGDEYVAGQGTEGELVESHGFDFVVESEEEEGEDAETLRLQLARASFMKSYYLFPSSKDSRVFLLGEENELLVALTNNNEKKCEHFCHSSLHHAPVGADALLYSKLYCSAILSNFGTKINSHLPIPFCSRCYVTTP